MRLRVAGLRRVVKRDFGIEFGGEQLTSYGGLELVRRYFREHQVSIVAFAKGSGSTIWAAITAAYTWWCW